MVNAPGRVNDIASSFAHPHASGIPTTPWTTCARATPSCATSGTQQADRGIPHTPHSRKFSLYGASVADAAYIDAVLDAVESIRSKYIDLIYVAQLADDAKAAYAKKHVDPATASERNGGAHFTYLNTILGTRSFMVGDALSIADIAVFDIVDLHLRILDADMRAAYPALVAHHDRVAAVPGVAKYLASPLRLAKVNGNDLG